MTEQKIKTDANQEAWPPVTHTERSHTLKDTQSHWAASKMTGNASPF